MTKKGLIIEYVKGEWGEFTGVIVFWNGQEVGRSVRDIDGKLVPNEDLQQHLTGNISLSDAKEFEEKVRELYRGNSWIFRLRKFLSSLFTK